MPTGITCDGLTAAEAEKVGRLAADIHAWFAPTVVAGCRAVGPSRDRALCFTRPDGEMTGCVAAEMFLATPDAPAVGLITVWHD